MEIALNVHGTRVVQKMIECADSEKQERAGRWSLPYYPTTHWLLPTHTSTHTHTPHHQVDAICAAVEPCIMELTRDMNGNHVIQVVRSE